MVGARLSAEEFRKLAKPKRAKYGNVRKVLDGLKFHSKGEAKRWAELKLLQRADEIRFLERQKSFVLTVAGHKLGEIIHDFYYQEKIITGFGEEWRIVAEDFKGYDNPLSQWKRAHFRAQYDIPIRITGASRRRAAA